MTLEIALFGGLRIAVAGEPITAFLSAKAPALVAYLAVTGREWRRDELAALLWGELADADAKNNLRQTLANLRRLLEPHLTISRETVTLTPTTSYSLDVATFTQLQTAPDTLSLERRAAHWQAATDCYTGDFLAGFFVRDAPAFEEWMLAQRAHYRTLALYNLYTLTQCHLDLGQYDRAILSATRLLALDEWREEAHCQLMWALARSGQRSAALAQYKRCQQLLRQEFDAEPAVETTALYERIKAALSAPRHNLPAATTAFVGRTSEIAELRSLLLAPNTRLLTILGQGGVGKTRLALEVAAACEPAFLNGVWFVALAASATNTPGAIALTIAAALGVPLSGASDPKTQLHAFLRQRELLLLLDQEDELTSGAWLSQLLAQAPGVKLLVTARTRLDLQAEQVYPLAGLPAPSLTSPAPQEFAAVQLFVARARQLQPDFVLSADEQCAVTRICRTVQGLPLGIELAAAWTPQLTCAEIAEAIERSLDFLATTRRDTPARQRSLRAVFDWSWRQLRPDEQRLFRRLAVFCGPFTRTAAGQVADAALPLLAALVDKSLVWRRGGVYQLHEVARHFATEKLAEAGEGATTQRRHAVYYADWLAQRQQRIKSSEQKAVLVEIEQEVENIRAAWQWLLAHGDLAGIAAATGALYHFYLLKSWFREGLEVFRAARLALQAVAATGPEHQLALGRVMARAARFCSSLSDYDQAQTLLAASLAVLQPLGAQMEVAFVLGHMGGIARLQGNLAIAEQRLHECLVLRRQIDDRWGQAITLLDLAGVAFMREAYETAVRCCEEGLVLSEAMGDRQISAHLLTGLSLSQRELGRFDAAEEFGRRSLAIYEDLDDKYGIMQAALTLGELSRQQGEHAAARRFCEQAVLVSQEIGDRSGEADGRYRLGQIAAGLDECDEALRQLRLALQQAHAIQETLLVLDILLEIACLLAAEASERAGALLAFLLDQPQLPDQRRARAAHAQARLARPEATARLPTSTLDEMVALASRAI